MTVGELRRGGPRCETPAGRRRRVVRPVCPNGAQYAIAGIAAWNWHGANSRIATIVAAARPLGGQPSLRAIARSVSIGVRPYGDQRRPGAQCTTVVPG